MKRPAKAVMVILMAILAATAYEMFGPSTPSRHLAEIEVPIPAEIITAIDQKHVRLEYAPVPSVEEANQYVDDEHREYLDFMETHLTSEGAIDVEISVVKTRSPFGRVVMEEFCKALVLQTRDTSNSDTIKDMFVIQLPSPPN